MGGRRRNWAKDKVRQQVLRAVHEARDRDAYFAEVAQARRGYALPSKAQLRQEADAAVQTVLTRRPIGRPWSPWRELTVDDKVPMTGEVYSAIACGGRMWERNR